MSIGHEARKHVLQKLLDIHDTKKYGKLTGAGYAALLFATQPLFMTPVFLNKIIEMKFFKLY